MIENGTYPDLLKVAEVRPIPKKKPSSLINNNRPISILLVFDKIIEKILHDRLITFFEKYNLLSSSQFGFRKGLGTDTAVLRLLDFLYPSFYKCLYSITIFADLTKAFDCTVHNRLLKKLWRYGIRGKALEIFSSFLTNRSQYVLHNSCKSFSGNVDIGIPQGSCLGPVLFIIFSNDLYYYLCNSCSIVQYADDVALVKSGNNLDILVAFMNILLYKLQKWCKYNSLCLNKIKTKAMIFTLKKYNTIPKIFLDGEEIEFVNNYKYLGVFLDSKLNFNFHLSHLYKKLSMITGISYYVGRYLNESAALQFYYAFVFSYISYGIVAWGGNINKTSVYEVLYKKHRRIVLNIFGKFGSFNYEDICKKYSLFKIRDIYMYFAALLVFKVKQRGSVLDLSEFLNEENTYRHDYNTRGAGEFALPFPRINVIKFGYIFNSLQIWNGIGYDIRCIDRIGKFKSKLKLKVINS